MMAGATYTVKDHVLPTVKSLSYRKGRKVVQMMGRILRKAHIGIAMDGRHPKPNVNHFAVRTIYLMNVGTRM
jgi:phosphotransacetylase